MVDRVVAAEGSEGAELREVLAGVLEGRPADRVVDRVAAAAAAALPGPWLVVVAGRSGPARLHGREVALPRRVVLALDEAAAGLGHTSRPPPSPDRGRDPAAEPVPTPEVDRPVWADVRSAPWDATADDLAGAGLAPPVLVPLVADGAPLGLLAAFPPAGRAASAPGGGPRATPPDVGVVVERLGAWPALAALALARHADRSRARWSSLVHDVTGLPARSLVMARLREALHRRPRQRVAVLEVVFDRLAALEDRFEEEHGGEILRVVGGRMRSVVRPGDVVGHLRDPVFVVVCEGAGAEEATDIGERMRAVLSAPVTIGGVDVAFPPGIGVVVADEADTVNSLLHKAGMAAREAVRRGSSEVVPYRAGAYEAAVARGDIERELRLALAGSDGSAAGPGALHLVYQPQVTLADGSLHGAEALVRWTTPDRGPVRPDDFIPVAEETGLVVALGEWAVDRALDDMARDLPGVVVSVNLSARQLDTPGLVEHVAGALARHAVDPARLRLEVTESALVRDMARSGALLRALHDLGVRISIDDFGTGYASLEHLRQMEVADTLKIDRTFVAGIADDARDRAIVSAAVTLGRSLGFTVVAEGVESAAQAEVLVDLGCDAAQGYWFGVPVPAADLARRAFREGAP